MSSEFSSLTSQRISPFICSTDDFTEERTYLAAHIFPQLQSLCRQRAASFLPYDWDHNLPEGRLEKGLALHLALRCIGCASPFFIGLLGAQYGARRAEDSGALPRTVADLPANADWIDKNIVSAAEGGYDWILDESYSSTSLFELKIIQAAFLCEESKFCRFYIRDSERSMASLPQAESDRYDKFKIQQLKASIAKRGLYVSYFSNLANFGELVLSDWKAIIDQLYPELNPKSISGFHQFADGIKHKRFGERRAEHLVVHDGVAECHKQLTEFSSSTNDYKYDPFIRAKQFEKSTGIRLLRKGRRPLSADNAAADPLKSICVVIGPRGCGKTATVSSWLHHELREVVPPGTAVISHYASCDRMARNIAVFMKRCIIELRRAFVWKYDDELSMETELAEFSQIKETFLAALALGPCLIVFDGLDEIAATMGYSMIEMKKMEWLPTPLPPTCKFVFTATNSDLCVKSLRQRKDVIFQSCPEITDYQSKVAILEEYLSAGPSNISLSKAQLSHITHYKLSSSPLYLYIIANELVDMNVRSDVDAHIDVYANLDSISTSTRDMWSSLIKRWVRDYSWTSHRDHAVADPKSDRLEDVVICGWVPDCLRLLACARDGLSVPEILGTLSYGMGYMGSRAVTTYDWYLFYTAARSVFYEKPNGLITINHEHFTEIIDFLLLGNISPPSLHETNIEFQSLQRLGGMERRQYHIALASHLLSSTADGQLVRIEEILWQLEIAADYVRLCNMLLIPVVIEKLYGTTYCTYTPLRTELVRLYKLLREKKVDVNAKLSQQLENLGLTSAKLNTAELGDTELIGPDLQSTHVTVKPQSHLKPSPQNQAFDHGARPSKSERNSSDSPRGENLIAEVDLMAIESQAFMSPTREMSAAMDCQLALTSAESSRTEGMCSPSAQVVAGSLKNGNQSEEVEDNYDSDMRMLISRPTSIAEAMGLAFTCAKLLLSVDSPSRAKAILKQIELCASQRYPLSYEELYVLCHVYRELSQLSIDREDYSLSLEQLCRSHECLLDISTEEDNSAIVSGKLKSYIKAHLKSEMSRVCIMSGDLNLAQTFINEARLAMEEIRCLSGTHYATYNQGLLKVAQQSYQSSTNYLLKCLDYFELNFGTMHPLVADVSHSLGKLLSNSDNQVTSDYTAAEEFLWKALNIRRERDAESLVTADSLFQLAFLVQKQGSKTRKKEAMELLQNCLDIRTNKLGSDHDSTKTVIYLLHDLEISLQLGQFEFGAARPTDNRSRSFPYSHLTMHEKALLEYNYQMTVKKQRASTSQSNQSSNSQAARPQSAFIIEKTRCESRLQQALVRRPKTAPTTLGRPISSSKAKDTEVLGDDNLANIPILPDTEPSTATSSPRTYRSGGRAVSITSNHSPKGSILEKYYVASDRRGHMAVSDDQSAAVKSVRIMSATSVKPHKCHEIGSHTIHKNLQTTTLGPNSTVSSVVGYIRPARRTSPVHHAAWYHLPNHYATVQKPFINPRVYSARKKRLMLQRSQSSPVRSRYLNDHTNAMKLIAQHEHATGYRC